MINMRLLLLGLLATGCIHAGQSVITFNPTNSMCIDSLVSNMQAAGCDVVSVEKSTYGIKTFSCHSFDDKDADSSWVKNEFYAIALGTAMPDNTTPICSDPFIVLSTN
tara:strand:+ start:1850 stop:2173 length:324 start_codon:yes stop_codon:yes gene_type:complete